MSVFMLIGAMPDVLMVQMALDVFAHLGYPAYLLPFIGVAKILGVIAVWLPGVPRLREWAYAGLSIDVIGAFYSHISVGDPVSVAIGPVIAFALIIGSYILYRRVYTNFI
jgi:hypothetical protein